MTEKNTTKPPITKIVFIEEIIAVSNISPRLEKEMHFVFESKDLYVFETVGLFLFQNLKRKPVNRQDRI